MEHGKDTSKLFLIGKKYEDFKLDPKTWKANKYRSGRGRQLTEITFADNGQTDDTMRFWSGDTLMDLDINSALKITAKRIDGVDYLFIEKGGYNSRSPKGWKPPLYVLKRAAK